MSAVSPWGSYMYLYVRGNIKDIATRITCRVDARSVMLSLVQILEITLTVVKITAGNVTVDKENIFGKAVFGGDKSK